jgi:hypothetical protein
MRANMLRVECEPNETLRLLVRVGERKKDQDQSDYGEHAEGGFLAVPRFGLPH